MMEIWQDIPSYEGKYQASTFGRIRSIKSFGGRGRPRSGNIIIGSIFKRTGRYMVKLFYTHKPIHRLIAITFIPNPENKPQVNHKDGNKLNNHVSNLEWVTGSENLKHAYRLGLKQQYGARNPSARMILETSTGIYYETIKEAATAFGLPYRKLWERIGKSNFIYA